MIIAKVKNQNVNLCYDEVVSDSVKYLKIRFEFSDDWLGYTKTAIFHNERQDTTITVLMVSGEPLYIGDNVCLVPHEVIKSPHFTVSVVGISGESTITADTKRVIVRESGYIQGQTPSEPTASEYERIAQLAAEASDIAASVREDADNGLFKGDKGDKGDTGNTGAKGDAFTYSDFTEEQLAALKGPKGDKGDTGNTGAKGDAFTYSDFTEEQLAALKGPKGDKGDTGNTGAKGDKGDKGDKSDKGDTGETPDLSSYYNKSQINTLLSHRQATFAYIQIDGDDMHLIPSSTIYFDGKFRSIHGSAQENEYDIVNRSMLTSYHDSTKQNVLTAGSNITISGDTISASCDSWRTVADVTLSSSNETISLEVDSDSQPFELKQIRIYLYVPQKADATFTNGYLSLATVGQSGYYISFGAPNFISKTQDNYWLIEIMPSNSFPACAKFSVSKPALSGGNTQIYYDKNGRSSNNYTKIRIDMNGSEGLPVGTHIVVEGIDA